MQNKLKYHLLSLLLLLTSLAFAQKPTVKSADHLFAKKSYVKAAQMYEQLKPTKEVLQNLGDCYYYNYEMRDAARSYGLLFFTFKDSINPNYYFKYAQALMGTDNYSRADSIMAIYKKYPVDTQMFITNLITNVPYNYTIQIMSKNTSNGDFGLSFYGEKVAFSSYRNAQKQTYNWNEKPYLDLFSASVSDEDLLEKIEAFPEEINSKTHESSATFSEDLKTMYFSRTGDKQVQVGDEKFASVRIMRAEFVDGKWTNIVQLPFSSENFSTVHPVLSKDGKKLYFSSDMPGTIGSFDLYVVDVNDDGTYGSPTNLGETINTIHREQFPSLSDDGLTIYFASDGHQGMGGMDLFFSKSFDGVYAKPMNLGHTINSSGDDFGFIVNEKTNTGYLSSNRKGTDNLYSFKRVENEEKYIVEGDVKDKNTKELLPGTTVSLYDENDTLVGRMVVGADADYVFNTEPNSVYRIEAVRDFYIPHSEIFKTNEDGKVRYTIELFVECYDDAEEIITKRQDGKIQIVLENIYFDLNKYDIKPEAARVLDGLYNLLIKYPEMVIELGAHTDSRASDTYNLVLSNRRARAAVEYLVSQGIDKNRLKPKGYGEAVPLVKCANMNGCSEYEHSINRRCEFIILR